MSAAGDARKREQIARLDEAKALASANVAKADLSASQWSIYALSANLIVDATEMGRPEEGGNFTWQAMNLFGLEASFDSYLESVERAWPDLSADADTTAENLRADKNDLYPRWMSEEFASYFQTQARKLSCEKPDFTAIRSRAYAGNPPPAGTSTKRAMGTKSLSSIQKDVARDTETFSRMQKEVKGIETLQKNCYEKFKKVASAFFEQKGAQAIKIPEVTVKALNQAIQRVNDQVKRTP